MPNPSDVPLDAWTGLSHKAAVGEVGAFNASPAPTWVGRSNRRRLNVYLLLWAYRKNAARFWLRPSADDPDRYLQHREYGDAELLVQTIRAAVLGGEPRALVDGAERELPPRPTAEDVDDQRLPDDETDGLALALAEWDELRVEIEVATARQEWLDDWWTDERVSQKVIETEGNAVGLGDGVYELVWSADKQRPRLRIHDPGFYFPVHDDGAQGDDFPDRVHLAWEFEDDNSDRFVRRITYDRRRLEGEATVRYAYDPTPSRWVVYKTDATWRIDELGDRRVTDLELAAATSIAENDEGVPIDDLNIGLDFIPVIHVPNTPAISELWGESALIRVAQILDDLAATDTDISVSAAIVGAPVITMSGTVPAGAAGQVETYGPGQIFRTGDGQMGILDNSKSLDALLKFQEALFERLSVVRQVPQSILGRVDINGQLAGITLLLSFGPFRQYVGDLRLTRTEKYALLLKFVQRIAVAGGALKGPVLDANLAFGSFLPTDTQALATMVTDLVAKGLMSRGTALRLLQEAGVDIESIEDELDSIRRLDFQGAALLADALGSEAPAAEYLGREVPEPAPVAPPAPPALPGGQDTRQDVGGDDTATGTPPEL